MAKFTYRIQPKETGLRAIANPYPYTDIKLKKLKVGHIVPPSRFGEDSWKITLAVKKEATEKDPSVFHWIKFTAQFDSEQSARKWLDPKVDALIAKYDLYQFED